MISDDCFFIVKDSKLICWDFQNHKQYELSAAHARRLVSVIYESNSRPSSALDQDFIRCGMIKEDEEGDASWGWDVLSRIYHFGTKNIPLDHQPSTVEEWAQSYLDHCDDVWSRQWPVDAFQSSSVGGISLPRWQDTDPFDALLKRRSTVREFIRRPVALETLGKLLQYSLGFIDERELPAVCGLPEAFRKRRSSPSGGGLNATEGYVVIRNVEGIKPGVYYYDPFSHALHLRSSNFPDIGSMLSGQHFADSVPVGLFLTSRFDKLWWKYEHSRAYRMALLEVGHVAQTFQLMATALGLSTWPTGALCEKVIDPLLKLANCSEQVLFFVGVGYGVTVTPEALTCLVE